MSLMQASMAAAASCRCSTGRPDDLSTCFTSCFVTCPIVLVGITSGRSRCASTCCRHGRQRGLSTGLTVSPDLSVTNWDLPASPGSRVAAPAKQTQTTLRHVHASYEWSTRAPTWSPVTASLMTRLRSCSSSSCRVRMRSFNSTFVRWWSTSATKPTMRHSREHRTCSGGSPDSPRTPSSGWPGTFAAPRSPGPGRPPSGRSRAHRSHRLRSRDPRTSTAGAANAVAEAPLGRPNGAGEAVRLLLLLAGTSAVVSEAWGQPAAGTAAAAADDEHGVGAAAVAVVAAHPAAPAALMAAPAVATSPPKTVQRWGRLA